MVVGIYLMIVYIYMLGWGDLVGVGLIEYYMDNLLIDNIFFWYVLNF